jgi:hypothetical protein
MSATQFIRRVRLLFILLACGSIACSDEDGASNAQIELEGSWTGEFGDEEISSASWNGATLVEFDNAENTAITQNAEAAAFDPGKFNKLVWTEPRNDSFYYCTVDYGLDSADAAAATAKTADEDDLEGVGCGGFPWSYLTRVAP